MLQAIRDRLSHDEDGFTLIELLVVVIIIGILAAIAIPTFLRQREKGWVSAAKAELRNAAVAQESYATSNNGVYVLDSNFSDGAGLDFEGYNKSSAVTLTVVSITNGTTPEYCMSAVHAAGGGTWYLGSGPGESEPRTTACT